MVDLPVNELTVSPVSFVPSCLNVKVRSMGPWGPSAVAFQLPVISAARAARAEIANTAKSRFMRSSILPAAVGKFGVDHRNQTGAIVGGRRGGASEELAIQ